MRLKGHFVILNGEIIESKMGGKLTKQKKKHFSVLFVD